MNPNPQPAPTTPDPAAEQPLVEFIRTQRPAAAYVLLGLSVVLLALTIWMAYKAFRPGGAPTASTPAPTLPGEPEPPKPEIVNPNKTAYTVGWVGALIGFLATASCGLWLLASLPEPTADRQRTQARVALLAVGGLIGITLVVLGIGYFYIWSESLVKLIDKGEWKEGLLVGVPLLMVVVGAGLVIAAVQPARAEERNNTVIRRLVYGANLGLTVLLLLVVLIVANVLFALKVPNKLDTTESGFYSLSDTTRQFLSKIPEPVTAYLLLPDMADREVSDVRQFLMTCQDTSDGKFRVRFVSPVSNRSEMARLQAQYPRIGRDAYGVLLTAGADEKRNMFIPFGELFDLDQRTGQIKAFAGEGRVMRDLRFLVENEQKPVVYFTQSNGELSVGGVEGEATGRSASQLKAFLEKNYLDVRPLLFALKDPVVPDDAAVVVVAEPQTPLSESAVGAIRKYMTTPRSDARKGKLIVLAGATPGAGAAPGVDNRATKTGLEGLLAEFGVRLGEKFLYSFPTQQVGDPQVTIGVFPRSSENPIVQTVSAMVRGVPFIGPREVAPLPGGPGGFQGTPLMFTTPGRPTWLEDERVTNWEQTIDQLLENPAVASSKGFTERPRPLAVVASEGGSPRVAVYGNAFFITDEFARRATRGGQTAPATFDLVGATIDWLRDRPPLATSAESKKYQLYTFPPAETVDTTRILFLPLGLALVSVLGLGVGVWVARRK
jgi:hypothetical protein